jgi:hypothetical protein
VSLEINILPALVLKEIISTEFSGVFFLKYSFHINML